MESIHLEAYVKAASQVFVWVRLSESRGLYVKTTKVALLDYLADPDNDFNEDIYIEYGDSQELYLGRAPDSEE